MSFEHQESAACSAPATAVWALWSDVGSWPAWDPAVEAVALEGEFAAGAGGTMRLAGGIEVPFVLEVVEPGARYLDRLAMGDLVIAIDHVVRTEGDGAVVTVSTTITGPGADDIGPMVTRDAPVALERLAAMAEGR